MPQLYLGIDTSNYKTSAAVTDRDNNIVFSKSEYLEVPKGSRGLRQSEAFFRHSCILPSYIEEICREIDVSCIQAAGVSSRPRRVDGSYMPCFLAGVNAAREIASVLGIPLHEFSHQEGHAAAVIESGTCLRHQRSALMHLSGGTTELLICEPDDKGYSLEIAGGTLDISTGQLIDRAGVAMGYPFPSGAYLDRMAESYAASHGRTDNPLPGIKFSDGYFNLSGTETGTLRLIEASEPDDYPYIAYCIFRRISVLLAKCALHAAAESGAATVYMAGGVSASSFIRKSILQDIRKLSSSGSHAPEIVFGDPLLSGDNAVGTARLARRASLRSRQDSSETITEQEQD